MVTTAGGHPKTLTPSVVCPGEICLQFDLLGVPVFRSRFVGI